MSSSATSSRGGFVLSTRILDVPPLHTGAWIYRPIDPNLPALGRAIANDKDLMHSETLRELLSPDSLGDVNPEVVNEFYPHLKTADWMLRHWFDTSCSPMISVE